jgi:predicted dehydrogenase
MVPKVLIVGVGSIGERHLRCFQNTGRCDITFCEVNDELRESIAERYQIEHCFADLAAAVADGPAAAVICTPADLHIPLARELATAGIHLLIEKPLSTNTEGIDALCALVELNSLTAGVAFVTRCHPLVQRLRREIRGLADTDQVVQATFVGGQDFPFFRPAYRDIYYARHDSGGGAIQDAMTHSVNTMQWLIGPMTSLVTDANHLVLPGVAVEDTVHVLARHGKIMSSWSLNQHQRANETTIQIICQQTILKLEFHTQRLVKMTETGKPWEVLLESQLQRDDSFVAQAEMFLDALAGQGQVTCTIAEANDTLQASLAMLESNKQRAWVDIDVTSTEVPRWR